MFVFLTVCIITLLVMLLCLATAVLAPKDWVDELAANKLKDWEE